MPVLIFIQKPGQTTLRILLTSVATTQPKGHRQPGRSSEENDQNDQWNGRRWVQLETIEDEATFTGDETTEKWLNQSIQDNAQLRGCETRGLLPATHRHWPKRSLSDHSQTALQAECAEIFLHTSSSGYLEQDEWGYSKQQDSEQIQKSDWPCSNNTGGAIHKPTKASCSRHSDPRAHRNQLAETSGIW